MEINSIENSGLQTFQLIKSTNGVSGYRPLYISFSVKFILYFIFLFYNYSMYTRRYVYDLEDSIILVYLTLMTIE